MVFVDVWQFGRESFNDAFVPNDMSVDSPFDFFFIGESNFAILTDTSTRNSWVHIHVYKCHLLLIVDV